MLQQYGYQSVSTPVDATVVDGFKATNNIESLCPPFLVQQSHLGDILWGGTSWTYFSFTVEVLFDWKLRMPGAFLFVQSWFLSLYIPKPQVQCSMKTRPQVGKVGWTLEWDKAPKLPSSGISKAQGTGVMNAVWTDHRLMRAARRLSGTSNATAL